MILNMLEKEYRALPQKNYSLFKDFLSDTKKYYRKWIIGEKLIEERGGKQLNEKIVYGNLVDILLTAPLEFDYNFQVCQVTPPTGQELIFVESLYNNTLIHSNEDGVLVESMETLYGLAFKEVGAKKGTVDTFKKKFVEGPGLKYYEALRDRGDRMVVTQKQYEQAEYLIGKLRTHPYCSKLINAETDDRWEVSDQLVLTGEIEGMEIKGKLDRNIVDKQNKVIYPWDYKIGSSDNAFVYNYTNMFYYLQKALYTLLVKQNYPDYDVKPLSFLAVDRSLYFAPMKHRGTEESLKQALYGFKRDGRKYPGLYQVMDDMKYFEKNNCWDSSRKAHENGGMVEIELYDELN